MSVDPSYRPSFNNCDQVNALCPVEASTYGDFFNLGACIFFTVFYAILLIYTTIIGIRGRTWTFTTFLGIGIVLELMGYAARIAMSPIGTVWNYGAFVIQLVMLILAPTLVAAAISVTFKWIVIQKGVKYSILRPNLYPWIFVGTDFLSIIIQAIGGAISATATGGETNTKLLDVGSDLLVAGVAFQVRLVLFLARSLILRRLIWHSVEVSWLYIGGDTVGLQNMESSIRKYRQSIDTNLVVRRPVIPILLYSPAPTQTRLQQKDRTSPCLFTLS
jgi:hypothetical protein